MKELRKDDLIKYVKIVKELEVLLYRQVIAYDVIAKRLQQYSDEINYREESLQTANLVKNSKITIGDIILWLFMTLGICLGCLILGFFIVFCKVTISNGWGILDIILGPATYTGQFMPSVKWSIACGILISVIIAIYVLITDSKDINLENKRIIQKVKETNRKIDNDNLKKRQKAKMAIKQYNVFKQEAAIISNQYDKICHLLDKYYSLNVIYPKYRKMVYMCQIYEYLASGRCETLTGPYGAYNILENDIKYNIIIEKLDTIISKLDSIIENQRELYNAIQECNRSINNLHNTLQSIASDYENASQSILDRLNTIDYNTQITAQCTQYTALYNYFKN